MSDTPRIIIADSYEIVREGIARRLETEGHAQVVGQAGDGFTAIKLCRQYTPDIVLLDLSLTRPSGRETIAKLQSSMPGLKIIVTSAESSAAEAFSILAKGASGFLPRQASGTDFVNAIRAAANDYACLPSMFLTDFVDLRRKISRTGNVFGLSTRELEVLEACAAGQKTKEVADRLSISVRTVETHRNSIYRKTDCRSIADLALLAEQI